MLVVTDRSGVDSVILTEVPPVGDILILARTGQDGGARYTIDDGERVATVTRADDGSDDDLLDQADGVADATGWVVTSNRSVGPDHWILQSARHRLPQDGADQPPPGGGGWGRNSR